MIEWLLNGKEGLGEQARSVLRYYEKIYLLGVKKIMRTSAYVVFSLDSNWVLPKFRYMPSSLVGVV
jgi:hypothetical protein